MQKPPPPQPGTVAARLYERKVTHVSRRPTDRLVDMKVLVLGLCRTGTASIRQALYELGYNDVYHMQSLHGFDNGEPEFWTRAFERKIAGEIPFTREECDQALGYCEAVTDVPPSMFIDELIGLYPNAKVILTTRDSAAAWHKSTLDTVYHASRMNITSPTPTPNTNPSVLSALYARFTNQPQPNKSLPPPPIARMMNVLFHILFGPGTAFETGGEEVYTAHNARVLAVKGAADVLVFNVKEGWGPLCAFLGVETPEGAFPRLNDSAFFRARVDEMKKKQMQAPAAEVAPAGVELGVTVAGVVGAVGVGVLLWRRYAR